jgi:hypothetical protein
MDAACATLEAPLDSSKHIIAQLLCHVQRSLTQGFQLPHLCPQIRGSRAQWPEINNQEFRLDRSAEEPLVGALNPALTHTHD